MKGHLLIEASRHLFALIILLNIISCKSDNIDFQVIDLNWSNDYIGELSNGFDPKIQYDYWACLRSGLPDSESIAILFKTNNLLNKDSIALFKNGFYVQGHVADRFYYIVTNKDEVTNYITETDELLDFFGEVNTMEEALMVAVLNNFNIDHNNTKGSSFRQRKDGFDFLLMKGEQNGKIEYRQYFVRVDKDGSINSEKREIYCRGYVDCYEK